MTPTLGVGLIGYAFMGAAHSQAWRTAPHFFDLPLRPELTVLAGRDAVRVADAAGRLGWTSTETDWRRVLERADVGLVDVCTPGDTHAEIAIAALEAGKHVLCEKPLANTVAEAEAMAEAAARAAARGVRSMVGFTYRRVPATTASGWSPSCVQMYWPAETSSSWSEVPGRPTRCARSRAASRCSTRRSSTRTPRPRTGSRSPG